jgi:hypothetical protein
MCCWPRAELEQPGSGEGGHRHQADHADHHDAEQAAGDAPLRARVAGVDVRHERRDQDGGEQRPGQQAVEHQVRQ